MSDGAGVSLILCPRCRMTLVSPVFERDALLKQHFRYGCRRHAGAVAPAARYEPGPSDRHEST